MVHVAIMKKSWGLTQNILNGSKTCESRWYKTRHAPWDRIKAGDRLYFKDSGGPVIVKAIVTKVVQFQDPTESDLSFIKKNYLLADLGNFDRLSQVEEYFKDKKYVIFIFFKDVKKIKPFQISKKGFGMQASWLTVHDIEVLRQK